jgi:hypothetical protein
MKRSIDRALGFLLVPVLLFAVLPTLVQAQSTDLPPIPTPSPAADRADDSFRLGVRGRRADGSAPPAVPWTVARPADAGQLVSAAPWNERNPQSTQPPGLDKKKSGWSDLSKTQKGWFIAGGALIVIIVAAAFSG